MNKLIIVTLSLFLFACQSSFDVNTTIKNASGKTYSMVAPYKNSQITLTIDSGKINGFAGVNRYFGTIEAIGNTIKMKLLATPLKYQILAELKWLVLKKL